MNMNVCTFSGFVVSPPTEVRDAKGKSVTDFRMGCKYYVDKKNNVERVVYFDVTLWGNSANTALQYFKKGHRINLTGRLVQGKEKGQLVISTNGFNFENSGTSQNSNSNGDNKSQTSAPAPVDSDIPF